MNIPVLFGFKYQVKALSFSENEAEPMDMKRTLTRKNKQLNNWQRRRGSTHNVAGVAAIKSVQVRWVNFCSVSLSSGQSWVPKHMIKIKNSKSAY